jgi:hypothetical protein
MNNTRANNCTRKWFSDMTDCANISANSGLKMEACFREASRKSPKEFGFEGETGLLSFSAICFNKENAYSTII